MQWAWQEAGAANQVRAPIFMINLESNLFFIIQFKCMFMSKGPSDDVWHDMVNAVAIRVAWQLLQTDGS